MSIELGRRLLADAKNRLREVRALSVLTNCFNQLRMPPDDGIEWYQRAPHMHLLFMKWALASWRPKDDRPEPTDDDMKFIYQTAWDALGNLHRSEGRPEIFFRRMLLQQIWFQRSFDSSSIARQFRIIAELMSSSNVMQQFERHTGMTPSAFALQLAHMAADAGDLLGFRSMSEQRPVQPRDPTGWELVRSLYTKVISQLNAEMLQLETKNTPAEVEICEQSPLIRSPFIDTAQGLVCLHHKLLFRMLECALFDTARALGPQAFMNDFGPAFEAFVAEVLGEAGTTLLREHELRSRLQGPGKVVDFALVFDEALVLLDAKGIEGHYDELYHNLPSELAAKLRTSVLNAVDQAVETIERLPDDLLRPIIYFVCVTFKQVAIGDGSALRELTIETPEWGNRRWALERLPSSRMFVASIAELEQLVATALDRAISLPQVLAEIVEANSKAETRNALLEMHLLSPGKEILAPKCIQRVATRLRESTAPGKIRSSDRAT